MTDEFLGEDLVLPSLDIELIKAVEEHFDGGPPRARETHDQLMVRAGQADVIRFLREQWERQNTTTYEEQD